jgi:hypothetical protein
MSRRLIGVLILTAACAREPGPDHAPVRGRSTLESCLRRIDSSDGTRSCDCLALIDPSDGIDASEAQAIAKAYFPSFVAELGAAGPPTRKGEEWLCTVAFGTSLQPGPAPIRINARTGAVSLAGHRSLASVGELRASVPRWCFGRQLGSG